MLTPFRSFHINLNKTEEKGYKIYSIELLTLTSGRVSCNKTLFMNIELENTLNFYDEILEIIEANTSILEERYKHG